MYVIRDVFKTKPGKAKDLVAKFKKAAAEMKTDGINIRVMTDTVSTFWTVVVEFETDDLTKYFNMGQTRKPEVGKAMEGYMELVNGGHREIFKVE